MRTALLSVTDKTGIVELAKRLVAIDFRLLSTGGTAKTLREAGLSVTDVSKITGFPEILNGRVKTLHPKIHGGLLGDLRLDSHRTAMAEHEIGAIELLCVNLYQFADTISKPHSLDEAIESIDIGGPAMIRAGAKNFANVTVVVDPKDYDSVLRSVEVGTTFEERHQLAAKAFRHTAFYDSMVSRFLTSNSGEAGWPETITVGMQWDNRELRYGENPHQMGARYLDPLTKSDSLRPAVLSSGKEISYNNWLDAEAAWELVSDLPIGACAIFKHGNPCGVAIGSNLGQSYRSAKETDPISAFGGVVAFHGKLDHSAVEALTDKGNFLEVIISEGWSDPELGEEFLKGAAWTKNVRFLEADIASKTSYQTIRSIRGGYLVQDSDEEPSQKNWEVVTLLQPTENQSQAIKFLWAIIPHVKSNAIVVGTENRLLGVGAGQMNRVQSVRLAIGQAGSGASGAVLASDAFFPFPDSIETAANAGISAIIQPGGSKKDSEVIEAANELGIAMVFTGVRHFRH